MTEQILLLATEDGRFTGEYAPRSICHTGKGRRHMAFTTLLYNSKKQVLLQHRKHAIFDRLWDLAGASHPLHLGDRDETMQEANDRFLKAEWNTDSIPIEDILGFNYFAQYGEKCENEHCRLLVGEFDGVPNPNVESAYGYKWISLRELANDVAKNPQNYTPWLIVAIQELQKHQFAKQFL